MIHLLLAITITRHIVNDIVGLHIGGLAPTTNVIHWQALSGNPSGGENIDLNGSRLSPDSAFIGLGQYPFGDSQWYEVKECIATPTTPICEPDYHQEVPLQCTDDVFVTPDATHEECDQLLYHTEAP